MAANELTNTNHAKKCGPSAWFRGVNQTTNTTISSREFNQGASEAKRAANTEPVFITDRGRPAHVLMRFEAYQQLTRQRHNIAAALVMPGNADIEHGRKALMPLTCLCRLSAS